ncbi:MAG: hypothetical protein J5824_05400 [Lachnospiraceae bacterium]|nr:hypothetical protein [Lachnospiraceae bacterium]
MKKCPYCKIEVGGVLEKCPLCQSRLTGENEDAHFPLNTTLKFRSFLYKLHIFIIWAVMIVGIGLDFLFGLRIPPFPELHWSLILAMWLMTSEYAIVRQFRLGTGSARKVTMMVFIILIMLLITAHYFDFMWLAWGWMVPIVLTAMIAADFVLVLLEKQGNAMAYLLSGQLLGLIPCIVLYFREDKMQPAWMICMIVTVVLFAGVIVFKGRSVAKEVRRRFNL